MEPSGPVTRLVGLGIGFGLDAGNGIAINTEKCEREEDNCSVRASSDSGKSLES